MTGKNYGVFRRRPDYLRHVRRSKPITITAPPVVAGSLKLSEAKYRDHAVYKRRTDYLWHVRRIKPVTITGISRVAVLRSTAEIFRNRAVYRREYDYWVRYTRRIMPITIAAPVLIDGAATIQLTAQYQNIMTGSDFDNNKWDILGNYIP